MFSLINTNLSKKLCFVYPELNLSKKGFIFGTFYTGSFDIFFMVCLAYTGNVNKNTAIIDKCVIFFTLLKTTKNSFNWDIA